MRATVEISVNLAAMTDREGGNRTAFALKIKAHALAAIGKRATITNQAQVRNL